MSDLLVQASNNAVDSGVELLETEDAKSSGLQSTAESPDDQHAAELLARAQGLLIQLDALQDSLDVLMVILQTAENDAGQRYDAFLARHKTQDEETLTLTRSELQTFTTLQDALHKAVEARRMVPQSFLVSMVSQYDAYLSASLRLLFKLKPEKIRANGKSISVSDVAKYATIEDLLYEIVSVEIDEVFRGSHLDQLIWIAGTFDFTLDQKRMSVQRLVEVTERRNLYVHNDGRMSKHYQAKCRKLDPALLSKCTLGEWVGFTRLYSRSAHNALFEVGILTMQVAWRKARPDQTKQQNQMLLMISYDLLIKKEYDLAQNIGEFAASLRNVQESWKRRFVVNQALAYKLAGRAQDANKCMASLDWSASGPLFKLANDLIADDYSRLSTYVEQIPTANDEDALSAEAYRTWPLFQEARERSELPEAFQKKFGESLVPVTINLEAQAQDDREDLAAERVLLN